jgi:hypothetical protein
MRFPFWPSVFRHISIIVYNPSSLSFAVINMSIFLALLALPLVILVFHALPILVRLSKPYLYRGGA